LALINSSQYLQRQYVHCLQSNKRQQNQDALPPELLELALEVKETMTAIQKAGAGKEDDE
jgi:hypothetical protein